jgi:hypothetical protein
LGFGSLGNGSCKRIDKFSITPQTFAGQVGVVNGFIFGPVVYPLAHLSEPRRVEKEKEILE